MRHGRIMFAGLALLLAHSPWAQAFTLSPMSVSFDPSGSGATRTFQVENEGPENIAIEIFMATRDMDSTGKDSYLRTPETEKLFLVYPPQLILKPKEKRSVRVSWLGKPDIDSELAFRIVGEQLPVQIQKAQPPRQGAIINILMKYVGAVYITPKGAKPRLTVVEAKRAGTAKDPKLRLSLRNDGNTHVVLRDFHLKITGQGGTHPVSARLGAEDLPPLSGQNLLAGKTRLFEIPWPKSLSPYAIQDVARVDLELEE